MKVRIFKITVNALLLAGFSLTAQAQKLEDVQQVNMLAPANLKIDGKNTEWNDTFQAENKRTSIFYTICNDDKNLYLVVKSTDISNNTKILAGGITLSVNTDGKKKEKESIALTYPLAVRLGSRGGQGGGRRGMMGGGMGGGGRNGADMTTEQRDSMMAARQKAQLAIVKEIKLKGFKNTTDTLISIYNVYGIKAFATIDDKNAFFYELAIPLDALGISKDTPKEFAYNIKLNGLQIPGYGGFGGGGGGGGGAGRGGFGGGGRAGGGGGRGSSGIDFQSLMSPTDFWGKYTIVKK